MSYQKDIINKNKNHQSSKNTLSMGGRIPAMTDVYIRNFTLLRTSGVGQAKTSRAPYIAPRPVVCPQCRSRTVKLYDHYSRKAAFINDEGVRRVLIIKARRVKCLHCSYLFREPIEGLLPKNAAASNTAWPWPRNTSRALTTKPLPANLASLQVRWKHHP